MYKICFITTIPGTIKTFILSFANYLQSTGEYDITFICDSDDEFRKIVPESIKYIPIKMKRGMHLSAFKTIRELIHIFKDEKFDLIQYSTPNASVYSSIAGKHCKVPVRLYCQWGIAYVGFSGIKRKLFKMVERMVCSLSTWIEPDSYGNLYFSHAERLYPETKGSVVWNGSASGVSLNKFDIEKKGLYRKKTRSEYNIPDNSFVFGFVGRITGDKGINELFSAFKIVEKKRDNVYLMLVGPQEKAESVDQQLYNYAITNKNVIMCGKTQVVEQFISAIDCFVLPSYREGFGLAVVEAEAMGIPVIVTDIPGPTDAMVPNTTGIVIPKKDVESLADAMLKMIDNPEMRANFGEAGVSFAKENYDQKVLFEKLAEDRKRLIEESLQ